MAKLLTRKHTSGVPEMSVVIPAFNEEKNIRKTLDSLVKQKLSVPFEIIVVNNNSTDKTAEVVRSYGNKVILVNEKRQGIGHSRQKGFEIARAKIIASTDADSVMDKDWISKMLDEYRKYPKIVGTVGIYRFELKPRWFNSLAKLVIIAADYFHRIITGSFAFRGPNFSVKRDAWLKAGGFKANSFEDLDLSVRVCKIGLIKYVPSLCIQTTYRRFEGRFLKQFCRRMTAYYTRVIRKDSEKKLIWEDIR
jgi:glycosyltransferase involved in cell wall biosynthesis